MKLVTNKFVRNFSYSLLSNLMSILLNFFVLLIIPKFLTITHYSYYQLYVFYCGYIGFFHLGWCDGIYLRYGGKKYENLNKINFSSQFWGLCFFELIVSVFLYVITTLYIPNLDKSFILSCTIFTLLLVLPTTMISYILQATNRIKEYALIIIVEKILFLVLILTLVLVGVKSYKPLLICDILSKCSSLAIAIYICRDIITTKFRLKYTVLKEIYMNLKVGSKLMIANIAGTLILGIIRISIESAWSVEVFGKVSLSITFSNILMIFISSVSVVLFPTLRRMDKSRIKEMYPMIRTALMGVMLGLLLFYYPISYILSIWLPKYNDSIIYMSILFPVCIYESKMTLLVNTYLKAIRKESILLYVNILSVLLSIVLTFINVVILKDLNLTVFSIIIIFAFKSITSELILSRYLEIKVNKDIILEFILSIIFIYLSWFIGGWIGFTIYAIVYSFYLFFKIKDLKSVYLFMRRI